MTGPGSRDRHYLVRSMAVAFVLQLLVIGGLFLLVAYGLPMLVPVPR